MILVHFASKQDYISLMVEHDRTNPLDLKFSDGDGPNLCRVKK